MARGKKAAATSGTPVEGPWTLPEGWRWGRLDEISDEPDRGPPLTRFPGTFRYLDVGGLGAGLDASVVKSDLAPSRARQFLAENDIAFSNVRVNLRRISLLGNNADVASTAFTVLRPRDVRFAPWIRHWVSSDWFISALLPFERGGTPPAVLERDVRARPIPLPPPDVMIDLCLKIDDLFSEIYDGEAALARARADLEVYRRSLLKAAVTGNLTADWRAANPQQSGQRLLNQILADRKAVFQTEPRNKGKKYQEPLPADTTGLPQLPEAWTWASLQQLAFISGGVTVDSKRKPVQPVTVPYLRVANVQRGWLDLRNLKTITVESANLPGLRLMPNDMLLNEGGDRDKVGRGWVFEGQIKGCIHQNHVFKARPASALFSPHLTMAYLNEFGRQFFFNQGKQTTNLASISLTKLSSAPVPCVPRDEAEVILARLSADTFDGDDQIPLPSDADNYTASLRQSILAAAFRGDLA